MSTLDKIIEKHNDLSTDEEGNTVFYKRQVEKIAEEYAKYKIKQENIKQKK